ncbi:MAG: glutamate-5-semialdehyde dehydrogenase [Deltaproteobacteria bacterium]
MKRTRNADRTRGQDLRGLACKAKAAARILAGTAPEKKSAVLRDMAAALEAGAQAILAANRRDLAAARSKRLPEAFIERLTLTPRRIEEMALSLKSVADLDDPVGRILKSWQRPNGLEIQKVAVPIGVILIIYESRPNVTSDCAGLCLKSGNAVILRGGSDALHSNRAIFRLLSGAVRRHGLPAATISFVDGADRRAVRTLLTLDDSIDLVMPRGGEALIREVRERSKIPVIKHYKGVCHIYVDETADFAQAERIVLNAKVQRPSVCNAVETLLVHEAAARDFLPGMVAALRKAGVAVRGCPVTRRLVKGVVPATAEDWTTEYLDLILSVRVVKDDAAAIAHINGYGSHHSDAVVTRDPARAERFLRDVDSACVYANASTRFTDGYQFGMGAEIGISTDRLHARGPMGLEELTTYKYVIRGNGQVRE